MTAAFDWSECSTMATWILGWLGRALLYGTLLAAFTWLIARVLGQRAPAALCMALWSLVLLKFLVPIGPAWSHSLAGLSAGLTQASLDRIPSDDAGDAAALPPGAPTSPAAWLPATGAPPTRESAAGAPLDWRALIAGGYLTAVLGLSVAKTRSYLAFHAYCRKLPGGNNGVTTHSRSYF